MQLQTYGGLAAYRQFIIWAAEPEANGKTKKYAVNPAGGFEVNTHDPANWLSLDEANAAAAAYRLHGPRVIRGKDRPAQTSHGVGFVFTDADPFFFFDLDSALQASGQWSDLAQQMCAFFAGCYVEVSLSNTGLHIIGTGNPPLHGCKNEAYKLELYHTGRFCALTGTGARGLATHQAQQQVEWLAVNYFPPTGTGESVDWTDEPCAEWNGPEDDDELIARMLAARGSIGALFGARATLKELWEGDEETLSRYFPPSQDGQIMDHSHADAALCQHLAFWTGKDCERMDRIFRESGLMRGKWEDREGYRRTTIELAVGRCDTVYGASQLPAPTGEAPTPVEPAPVMGVAAQAAPAAPGCDTVAGALRDGFQFLGITQQQQHFNGCVYIRDSHRIFIPDGALLKPDQFKATYGGYVFALDLINDKTTRNAWEAFTESQAFHFNKAHEVCFRPECVPGALIHEEGYVLVNTYVPITTRREAGDAGPFLDLMRRLLPDERDRQILLSYMAAMVQNPGAKFQWWPVIQGTEGNGKSAIIRVLNHCIGNRYSHLPNADAMAKTGNQFNGWVAGKLFMGIEEIYVQNRRDFLEAFKTTVTNDRLQIEGKGANQIMGDNRCNGIMCTNHQEGVPVTVDTRRYSIFYTAQQCKADKLRDGMTGSYFPDLYQWFRGEGRFAAWGRNYGYAVVNNFLHTYQVQAEFNPAPSGLCQEAPETSSTGAAIKASRGSIEQEIIEAIEEGRPGFAGGWVSSTAFDRLLEQHHLARSIAPNRRRAVLKSVGYDYHPALTDGRVSNPIPDPAGAGKPRLYIKNGHIHANLQSPAEVARHYMEAQKDTSTTAAIFGQQGAA